MYTELLAEMLNEALKVAGRTQESLATEIGVTQPTMSRWVTGASLFPSDTADDIAEILGIDADVLKEMANKASKERKAERKNPNVAAIAAGFSQRLQRRFERQEEMLSDLRKTLEVLESRIEVLESEKRKGK